jgi:hypothetical protein
MNPAVDRARDAASARNEAITKGMFEGVPGGIEGTWG